MSQATKENVDINTHMGELSIDAVEVRKSSETNDGKKQSAKTRYAEKKKYKQSCQARNDRPTNNDNIVTMSRKVPVVKTKSTHYVQHQVNRPTHHSEYNRSNVRRVPSKFCIHITDNDIEVCRQTAIRLNSVRESITVDPHLANHLSHLSFVTNQYLFDQQRSMFVFHEQLKQMELAKWLNSRSAEERKEYIDRMGVEPAK